MPASLFLFVLFLLPATMKRAPLSPRAQRMWRLIEQILPPVRLSVVCDTDMRPLIDKPCARQADFHLRLPLAGTTVAIDLYRHYIAFAMQNLKSYAARETFARTYVKHGHCLQEFCELQISISRLTDSDETERIR